MFWCFWWIWCFFLTLAMAGSRGCNDFPRFSLGFITKTDIRSLGLNKVPYGCPGLGAWFLILSFRTPEKHKFDNFVRDLASNFSKWTETRFFRYRRSRRSYLAERVWPQMAYVSRSSSGDFLEIWPDLAKWPIWEGWNLGVWNFSGPGRGWDPSGWICIDVRTPKT